MPSYTPSASLTDLARKRNLDDYPYERLGVRLLIADV